MPTARGGTLKPGDVRMQLLWLLVIGVVGLVLLGVLIAIVVPIFRAIAANDPALGRSLVWTVLALPVALVFVSGIPLARVLRSERQILRRVPEMNGAVCPICRRPLAGDADNLSCPRCGQVGSAAEIRSFWGAYPNDAARVQCQYLLAAHRGTSLPGARGLRLLLAFQRRPTYAVLGSIGIWILIGVMMSLVGGGSVATNMVRSSWVVLMQLGFSLWSRGVTRREGDSVHCARCEYEQAKDERGERCPECANPWLEAGGVVRGRLIRRPAFKWAGAAVMAALAALFLLPLFFRAPINALKPTWLLLDEVVSTKGFTMSQWAELGGRSLSRDQELELMRGLLDRRNAQGSLSQGASQWLDAMLEAGAMPADLTARYYREMLRAEFAPAGTAAVGQPMSLTISITDSGPFRVHEKLVMVVDGTYVGDSSTPLGRMTEPVDVWRLPETELGSRRHRFATAEIVPQQPGPMRVRFVFWHLYTPMQFDPAPIVWSEGNRPVLPPSVIWSERVELETVVEVFGR